ncbi:MAG: ribosomal protein S18-alanine N-acetyltransferase [Elusimicrobiota bacterium]
MRNNDEVIRLSIEEELVFRRMELRDIDEVAVIESASFTSPWTRGMFESELGIGYSYFYVGILRVSGIERIDVVGYTGFWAVVNEGHILNFAVHPQYRRRRIGVNMINYTLTRMRGLGLNVAYLEVREGNTAAKVLYQIAGFIVTGLRKSYYSDGENAVVMKKEL